MNTGATPKDFFLHLLGIITLYMSIVSIITVLFQYVNVLFPDITSYDQYSVLQNIKWASAMLIIVFPVYVGISWLILKDIVKDPLKSELRVRRWLSHLTLFIAALTIIIDLITLVYFFLDGDLTARFIVKVLVILAVAGAIFGYYLWDVRRTVFSVNARQIGIGALAGAIVLISIMAGFIVVGSPASQRRMKLDDLRLSSLQSLQFEITEHWRNNRSLPKTLDSLNDPLRGFVVPVDPETGASFEYVVKDALSFELCAMFSTDSSQRLNVASKPYPMNGYSNDYYWNHPVGRTCFLRTVDPKDFPQKM